MNSTENPAPVSDTIQPESPAAGAAATDTQGMLYRTLYSCGYYASYGVMVPTLLLVRSIPLDNAAGRGLLAGAHDASLAADRAHDSVVEAADVAAQKTSAAYSTVARTVQEKVESIQDSLAARRFKKNPVANPNG